jgi:hypothetical protein
MVCALFSCKKEYVEIVPVLEMTTYALPDTGTVAQISFLNESVGYAVLSNKYSYYKTADGGATWQTMSTGLAPTNGTVRDVCFLSEQIGFLRIGGRIHRTTNAGATWVFLEEASVLGRTKAGQIALAKLENGFSSLRVRVSVDSGATFQNRGNLQPYTRGKVGRDRILMFASDGPGVAMDPMTGSTTYIPFTVDYNHLINDVQLIAGCGAVVGDKGEIRGGCTTSGFYNRLNEWHQKEFHAVDGASADLMFAVGENTISTNYDTGDPSTWHEVFDTKGEAIRGSFRSVYVVNSTLLFVGTANGTIIKCLF